jgi:hypothetical protein
VAVGEKGFLQPTTPYLRKGVVSELNVQAGIHETGTTSIQNYLYDDCEALLDLGVHCLRRKDTDVG